MAASKINAFANLPFNRFDSIYAINLKDDFVAFTATASAVALISELPWLTATTVGDSVVNTTVVAGVAKHPGILSLGTGATTPADGDVASLILGGSATPDVLVLDSNGIYLAAIIRIPDVDAQKVEFGLIDAPAAVNSSAANLVSIVFDPEDAANVGDQMFFLQVNAAGVDTEAVFDTALYDQADWALLELAIDNKGAVARITTDNGTQVESINTTMPTVTMAPTFIVEAGGGAEERLEIDAFQLRYLRRDEDAVVGV